MVTTPLGTSATSAADQFAYEAAPSVSALSPVAGPLSGGTTVVITGTGFSGPAPSTSAQPRPPPTPSARPRLSPPPRRRGPGTVDITVTTPSGTSATSAADQFSYEAAPAIS